MAESLNFDDNFRLALLTLILTNKDVISKLKSVKTLPESFEDELSQTCAEVAFEFYAQYEDVPTYEQLLYELESRGFLNVQKPISSLLNTEVKHPDWYVDKIFEFQHHQLFKAHIEKAAMALDRGNLSRAELIVKDATKLTPPTSNIGFNFFQDMNLEYSEDAQRVPTSIKPLDDAFKGGLAHGELGIIMAPSGVGKSMFLCFLGAMAVKHKYKVAHFTLELSEEKARQRYEAALTQIPKIELKARFDEKCKKLTELHRTLGVGDSLYIAHYPTKSLTIPMLDSHLEMMDDVGFHPDLVIVDYIDLIRWPRNMDKHDGLGDNSLELRRIAGERGIPVWSATQTNRDAMDKIIYGLDNVSDSLEKIRIADVVVNICQTEDECKNDMWRLFVAKNRDNRKGQEIECTYDFDIVDLNLSSTLLD